MFDRMFYDICSTVKIKKILVLTIQTNFKRDFVKNRQQNLPSTDDIYCVEVVMFLLRTEVQLPNPYTMGLYCLAVALGAELKEIGVASIEHIVFV